VLFALAVQSVYDDFVCGCRKRKIRCIICDTMQIVWSNGKEYTPPLSAVLYDLSRGDLREEAGKLSPPL